MLLGPNVFLGEGVRRCEVNDIDAGSPGKGYIQQTHLFSNEENFINPPSSQAVQSVDIVWLPFIG